MCSCNHQNNNCSCLSYDGSKIIYTGINITSPFGIPRGTTFNQFVLQIMNYLSNSSSFVTITYNVTPSDATVTINGQVTDTLSVQTGSNVTVSISRSGYNTYTNTFVAPFIDTVYNITLTPISTLSFDYFWGEIGNIFSLAPSGITESNWDNLIKPNGTSGGMNFFDNANALELSYERDSTGGYLQWWIILIPSSEITVVSELTDYSWKIYDQLSNSFLQYEGTVYTGTVTLDSVNYTYSAIRPLTSNKIQFSINAD